jgi:hypothetical protein
MPIMWPWKKKGGERRGGARRKSAVHVGFRVVDAITRKQLSGERRAVITNLSEDGCGLSVPELLADTFNLNTCLQFPRDYLLELKIKPTSGGTWRLHAAVRWIEPDKFNGNGFKLGVRFEDPVALPNHWQRLLLKPNPPAMQAGAALADASGN